MNYKVVSNVNMEFRANIKKISNGTITFFTLSLSHFLSPG